MKKSALVLGALATAGMADTAQFANTSFIGPFTVGQTVPLMWTTGNGLPISLSIINSTWSHEFFNGRSVLPTNYNWVVAALPGFASGSYQLSLRQLDGGISKSPAFQVVGPDAMVPATTSAPAAGPTTTVTWLYFDHACACTKTGTATAPLNTVWPTTTTTWWDDECGCKKSASVPVPTVVPGSNNYTIPAAPPAQTTLAPTASPQSPTTAASVTQSTFRGGAASVGSSMFGIFFALGAVALF